MSRGEGEKGMTWTTGTTGTIRISALSKDFQKFIPKGLNVKCVGHGFVQGSANLLYAVMTGSISDGQGC